jgi:bifunctional DNase/RNase
MALIKLNVIGLTYAQLQQNAYALVLGEENGDRRMSIVIGAVEAQAIAMHLQGIHPSRPLTHDLFAIVMEKYQISLRRVFIYKIDQDLFFTELLFRDKEGVEIKVDSRTSDAIALAVRMQTPIYATEDIMNLTNQPLTEDDDDEFDSEDQKEEEQAVDENNLAVLSIEELEAQLQKAVENEAYERAALIKEELKHRQKE